MFSTFISCSLHPISDSRFVWWENICMFCKVLKQVLEHDLTFFVYLLAGFGLMSQMFRLYNGQKELKGKLGRYWEIVYN